MKRARKSVITTVTSVTATTKGSRIKTSNKTQVKMNTCTSSHNSNREDAAAAVEADVGIDREVVTTTAVMEIINRTKKAREEAGAAVVDMAVKVEAEENALINKIVVVNSKSRHPEKLLST